MTWRDTIRLIAAVLLARFWSKGTDGASRFGNWLVGPDLFDDILDQETEREYGDVLSKLRGKPHLKLVKDDPLAVKGGPCPGTDHGLPCSLNEGHSGDCYFYFR